MGIRQQTFLAYDDFVKKFEPKKTTDDCYTPPTIYQIVLDWVMKEYNLAPDTKIIRPFYPNCDYETFDYPEGCVVVDNPPFSIISKICNNYNRMGVKYFLFAPHLVNINICTTKINHILAGAQVTYENGANVSTSFVTNMGEYVAEARPDLHDLIEAENNRLLKQTKKQMPKYTYPDNIITASKLGWMAMHGTTFKIKREDCIFIRQLEAQNDKGIFGGGLLLSTRAAAERAAAERAAATKWQLSPKELQLIDLLDAEIARKEAQKK